MTLTEFLTARLDEDEAWARNPEFDWGDPVRALAEVEAKRGIVGLHPEMLDWCQGCAHESYPCRTLRLLALPYADHPDYDAENWPT